MEEPDPQVLADLLQIATQLEHTAKSCPRGLKKTDQAKEKGVSSITELLHTKKWLRGQIEQYEKAILAAKMKDSNLEGEALIERVEALQEELQTLALDKSIKDQIVKSLCHGQTLIKKLFPAARRRGSGDQQHQAEDKLVIKLVESQTILVSDILQFQRSIVSIRDRVDDLQKENLALKESNRHLMVNIREAKDTTTATSNGETAREIASALEKAEVIRNIFNGLVLGSTADWAEDEELQKLLFSLGEPLEAQIK